MFFFFQKDPNEDTEWNDVLRAKGIIPPKEPQITEDDIVNMLEETIEKKAQGECILCHKRKGRRKIKKTC